VGEIWTLDGGLTQKMSGIAAPAIAAKPAQSAPTAPGPVAVVDMVGVSMATVSLDSGAVTASAISSEAVAASRAASQAVIARAAANPRMATPIFITAIGGASGGAVYAVVPMPRGAGVVQVVSLDSNGAGKTILQVQQPLNSAGRIAGMASRIVIADSQLGVLTHQGNAEWYALVLG
jgi:hypothetical protein